MANDFQQFFLSVYQYVGIQRQEYLDTVYNIFLYMIITMHASKCINSAGNINSWMS